MLDLFPIPLLDERLFSVVARYHVYSGNTSCMATLEEVFGARTVIPDAALPSHLGVLARRLPKNYPLDIQQVILKHTSYPYYCPFMDERRAQKTLTEMIGNDGRGTFVRLGLAAAKAERHPRNRFCLQCVVEDVRNHGEAYWHRSHQLPGVFVCATHQVPLLAVEITGSLVTPSRHGLYLPSLARNGRAHASIREDHTFASDMHEKLVWFAQLSEQLLFAELPTISLQRLRNTYRYALIRKELATETGRIRQAELHQVALEKYGPQFLELLHSELKGENSASWLAALVRKPRRIEHPVRHLLFIGLAFDSFDEFVANINSALLAKSSSVRRSANRNENWQDRLKVLLQDQKLSARRAAAILGKSVTSVVVAARRLGIPVAKRPKTARERIDPRILYDAVSIDSVATIAARHGVSTAYVYRLIRVNPVVESRRRKLLVARERNRNRTEFLRFVRHNPRATRKEIQKRCSAIFAFLYRNNRHWLYSHLPPNQKHSPAKGRTRVDWVARDSAIVDEVRAAARTLLNNHGKPLRATASKVARLIGKHVLIEKYGSKLPQTLWALKDVAESVEQFEVRRVRWATSVLRNTGQYVADWKIRRLGGLRNHETADGWLVISAP